MTEVQPIDDVEIETICPKEAPRVTAADVDANIANAQYFNPEGTLLTICILTLANGFTVTGESACASPENFDEHIGKRIAFTNARDKIWPLMGYELKQRLSTANVHELNVQEIARLAHEINRAYCQSIGDDSQVAWEDAPDWQTQSAINGVKFNANNRTATPEDNHNSWLSDKELEGWAYGTVKDVDKREHPCMVPYHQLPEAQRFKDAFFTIVCRAFFPAA